MQGPGCAILAALLFAGLVVRAFEAAPFVSSAVVVSLVAGVVALFRWSREKKRIAEAEAKAEITRQEERRRNGAIRQVRQEFENRAQDSRDDVRLIVNRWRVTPTWLIDGRGDDARRYSLAGLATAYKAGYLVITGPGVRVAEKVEGATDSSLARYANEIARLCRVAEAAGPPILPRRCAPYCACPAGHEGFHGLAPTADPALILRTCLHGGCGQRWRERA
ncbi:hypothetical protein GCM10023192_39810 [Amycolatopsis samaneae]